jgi:hypothetical protein
MWWLQKKVSGKRVDKLQADKAWNSKSKARNPKSEARNPNEIPGSKTKTRRIGA